MEIKKVKNELIVKIPLFQHKNNPYDDNEEEINQKDTITTTFQLRPIKPGICEREGLEHAWEGGPTLTNNPTISTRHCVNCGQVQWLRHTEPQWENR